MVLMLGFVTFVILFGVFAVSPALAQQTSNVTITDGSGLGQMCVAARNCFNPHILHILSGTTVTWNNTDHFSHTVTSGSPYDDKPGMEFDSSLIAPDHTFTFTFEDIGTYHYFCEIHPWMRGEIDVTPNNILN